MKSTNYFCQTPYSRIHSQRSKLKDPLVRSLTIGVTQNGAAQNKNEESCECQPCTPPPSYITIFFIVMGWALFVVFLVLYVVELTVNSTELNKEKENVNELISCMPTLPKFIPKKAIEDISTQDVR